MMDEPRWTENHDLNESPIQFRTDDQPGRISFSTDGVERLAIEGDGSLTWNGRAVETDDELRAAMIELHLHFVEMTKSLP